MTTLPRHAPALTALGLLLLLATSSWAQSPAPADEVDAIFFQAKAAFDGGKLKQAYELYRSAWALRRTHDIAGNLAQVELALGKKRDAAEHLAFALAHFPPTVSARSDRHAKLKKVFEDLRKDVAMLRIQVSVAGAKVAIDGAPVGDAPLAPEVFVDPGTHIVEATLSGYKPAQAPVQAAKGSAQDVVLTMSADLPVAPPPPPPMVQGRRPIWPALVSGALAVGGLATGAGLTVAAKGKASRVAELRSGQASTCFKPSPEAAGQCGALLDAVSAKTTLSNAAASAFMIGGAFAVVGAGMAIWTASSPKPAPLQAVPVVGTTEVGLMLQGRW